MGLRINTNSESLAIQRNLSQNRRSEDTALERLASGSRINRAGDDAAGLSLSARATAMVRSLRQAGRNAADGISIVQVAEGALNEVSSMLIRMRELSIQAASDTIGELERGNLDKEFRHMVAEIDRIANSTEFNGQPLLNVEAYFYEIQSGIHNNPDVDRVYIDSRSGNSTAKTLGISEMGIGSKISAQSNFEGIDRAISRVSRNRAALGAFQNRLQSAYNNSQIYEENLAGARSRMKDTDMAHETAELTRANILTHSSTSLLSQANQSGTLALKLLG